MITSKDIYKAIVKTVAAGLTLTSFSALKFSSTDIREGFTRPSLFLELEDIKKGLSNPERISRTLTSRIYFFPTDHNKSKLELMDIQDLLENIFLEPLKINDDFLVAIEETTSMITDGVLQFSFKLSTREVYERADTSEPIETLDYQ